MIYEYTECGKADFAISDLPSVIAARMALLDKGATVCESMYMWPQVWFFKSSILAVT